MICSVVLCIYDVIATVPVNVPGHVHVPVLVTVDDTVVVKSLFCPRTLVL